MSAPRTVEERLADLEEIVAMQAELLERIVAQLEAQTVEEVAAAYRRSLEGQHQDLVARIRAREARRGGSA